jgi:hypothetical protein
LRGAAHCRLKSIAYKPWKHCFRGFFHGAQRARNAGKRRPAANYRK